MIKNGLMLGEDFEQADGETTSYPVELATEMVEILIRMWQELTYHPKHIINRRIKKNGGWNQPLFE